jgi:hypothetical protein
MCCIYKQVLSWFLDHQEENGLPICRLKNKFALTKDELVGKSIASCTERTNTCVVCCWPSWCDLFGPCCVEVHCVIRSFAVQFRMYGPVYMFQKGLLGRFFNGRLVRWGKIWFKSMTLGTLAELSSLTTTLGALLIKDVSNSISVKKPAGILLCYFVTIYYDHG